MEELKRKEINNKYLYNIKQDIYFWLGEYGTQKKDSIKNKILREYKILKMKDLENKYINKIETLLKQKGIL